MSLETALDSLQSNIGDLKKVLSHVSLFLNEPVPLVDPVDNAMMELTSAAEEAAASLSEAIAGCQPNGSLDAVFDSLGRVHDALNRCTRAYVGIFVAEIPKHDSLHEQLIEGGRIYDEQWLDWSRVVRRSIKLCAPPITACAGTLKDCWHELAVRLSRQSVSVQATNIGQQITVRDEQLDEVMRAT